MREIRMSGSVGRGLRPPYPIVCAFHGQTRREPIRFARRVFEDLTETKCCEPPRGSWTHVSLIVVAVHDDRLIPAEPHDRLRV